MPDPNNIILMEHGLVFMLQPKAANTSIKMAVMKALGITGNPHRVFENVEKDQIPNGFLKIAFVRHPESRIQSCWRDKVNGQVFHGGFRRHPKIVHHMPFGDFVRIVHGIPDERSEQHIRSQYHELYHNDDLVPDYVGHVESIDDDWEAVRWIVSAHTALALPPLERSNESAGIRPTWTVGDRALVYERYRQDYEAFGYAPMGMAG